MSSKVNGEVEGVFGLEADTEFCPFLDSPAFCIAAENNDEVVNVDILDVENDDISVHCINKKSRKNEKWSDTEKDLFIKGLDLFGSDYQKISQFVSSKSLCQVKLYHRKLKDEEPSVIHDWNSDDYSNSLMVTVSDECQDFYVIKENKNALFNKSISDQVILESCDIVYDDDWIIGSQVSVEDTAIDEVLIDSDCLNKNTKSSKNNLYTKRTEKCNKRLNLSQYYTNNSNLCSSNASHSNNKVVQISCNENEDSDVDIDCSDSENERWGLHFNERSGIVSSQNLDIENVQSVTVSDRENNDMTSFETKEYFFSKPLEEELNIDANDISKEERNIFLLLFNNFFPERYLKIRNGLVNLWHISRPKYLKKTDARRHLKKCGNVNLISKVHEYLEKKGAINFNCKETDYENPLVLSSKKKTGSRKESLRLSTRIKANTKKWDGSPHFSGGSTLCHDETGAIVDVIHVAEEPKVKKLSNNLSQYKLQECFKYSTHKKPPFNARIYVSALVMIDIHAHASTGEVIGLLGGRYDSFSSSLEIILAVPTKAKSSGIECEMCPVSQSLALMNINDNGLQVIGWYHSHPNFPARPSSLDIRTQSQMQEWFSKQYLPFIGVIVSPFSPLNTSYASDIRALVLESDLISKELTLPYELSLEVYAGDFCEKTGELLSDIQKLLLNIQKEKLAVKWQAEFQTSTTYWEKAVMSLALHIPVDLKNVFSLVKDSFLSVLKNSFSKNELCS